MREGDATRLGELLDEYRARQRRGETVRPEDFRSTAGDLFPEFESLLRQEERLAGAAHPAPSTTLSQQDRRALALADLLLHREAASAENIGAALQRYWALRGNSQASIVRELAQIAGIDPRSLRDAEAEVARLPEDRLGEAYPTAPPEGGERYSDFLEIARGGMGVVYAGVDRQLRRPVALKLVRTEGPAPRHPFLAAPPDPGSHEGSRFRELRARFFEEARITAGLEHPGVTPVYEIGETPGGVPYYTMRLVRGARTLADAIRESVGSPPAQRLALLEPFLKVCDTLHYAHSRGIVHRDLKPQNIALGEFGEVVVLDWGLAKAVGSGTAKTGSSLASATPDAAGSAVAGTPGYTAPECAAGGSGRVGPASDVYSLGAILREVLAGGRVEPAPDDPALAGLLEICERALDPEISVRPGDAGALASALRGWQGREAKRREEEAHVRDVTGALDAADASIGDARLRHVDRAAGLLQRESSCGGDRARLDPLISRIDTLRQKGVQERTAALLARRRQRLAGIVAVAATLGLAVLVVLEVVGASIRARSETARRSRFDHAIRVAEDLLRRDKPDLAMRHVERAEAEIGDAGRAEPRCLRLRALCHSARGETEDALLACMKIGGGAPHAEVRQEVLSAMAEVLEKVGDFRGVCGLLGRAVALAPRDRERLIHALLLQGRKDAARRLMEAAGDRFGLDLLRRFSLVRSLPLPGAYSVAAAQDRSGQPIVVALTVSGGLFRADGWDLDSGFRPIPVERLARGAHMVGSFGDADRVWVSGFATAGPDQHAEQHFWKVLDIGSGGIVSERLDIGAPVRGYRIDLDADGISENIFVYWGTPARGIEVFDGKGEPWPRSRMGALGAFDRRDRGRASVDVHTVCAVDSEPGSPPLLWVGTGKHDGLEAGYSLLAFRWDPSGARMRELTRSRVGVVRELGLADLEGNGARTLLAWIGAEPSAEMGHLFTELLAPGIHRVHGLAAQVTSVRRIPTGGWIDGRGFLRRSVVEWGMYSLGPVRLDARREASATIVEILTPGRGECRYIELLSDSDEGARSFVLSDAVPSPSATAMASADLIDRVPGDELMVATGDGVVLLGAEDVGDGAAIGDGECPGPLLPCDTETLADDLRALGYRNAAASGYEWLAASAPTGHRPGLWRKALRSLLEAEHPGKARDCLDRFRKTVGADSGERDYWIGEIAMAEARFADAARAYSAAAASATSCQRAEGSWWLADAEAGEALARSLELTRHEFRASFCDGREPLEGGSAEWTISDPRIARLEPRTGLRAVLHGERSDLIAQRVEVRGLRTMRLRARFVVEEQEWGSSFVVGMSRGLFIEDGILDDFVRVVFDRADGSPRRVRASAWNGNAIADCLLTNPGAYAFRWGRPLILEAVYRDSPPRFRAALFDGIDGGELCESTFHLRRPLGDGDYWLGFQSAAHRSAFTGTTRLLVYGIDTEIWAAHSAALAADRTRRVRSDASPEFVGPFVDRTWNTLSPAIAQDPGIAARLLAAARDCARRGRRFRDPQLLADLFDDPRFSPADPVVAPLHAECLRRLGRSGDALRLYPPTSEGGPDPNASSVTVMLSHAPGLLLDGEGLRRLLDPLLAGERGESARIDALLWMLESAIARDDSDQCERWLAALKGESSFELERMNDSPAIRRHLESIAARR